LRHAEVIFGAQTGRGDLDEIANVLPGLLMSIDNGMAGSMAARGPIPDQGLQLGERTVVGLHETLLPKLGDLSRDTRILDIGCGTGAWMDRLGSQGYTNLHGIDLDTAQFRSRWGTCSQANLDHDAIGLEGHEFGLITAIELIEHLENPGRLLFHVHRLLTADGCLLVTTPNIESVLCRMRFLLTGKLKQFDEKGDPTHIYPVLTTCLERILDRYGLVIQERWGYPEGGGSVSSRWTTRLASRAFSPLLPRSIEGDITCFRIRRSWS
jgi:2-polyprenyl-3-methyl-5-hydroxy-6-metoxy-1,4-benzoquinol methylase